jgi:phage terminase small subunit
MEGEEEEKEKEEKEEEEEEEEEVNRTTIGEKRAMRSDHTNPSWMHERAVHHLQRHVHLLVATGEGGV